MSDSDGHKRHDSGTVQGTTTSPDQSEPETIRDAVERSRHGAPAVGSAVRDRFSSDEVFQRIIADADEEITSGSRELFFSALAAGFAITITFLLYVSLYASTDGHPILKALLYPLGFIYIIIGGYQLYTENTLPPVALTLERLVSLPGLLRHWTIVLLGNFIGGAFGAAALTWGGVLSDDAETAAMSVAQGGIETGRLALFSKAAFAGLIVAGVVWVTFASRDTISRLVVVYLAFLAIPLGNLYHVVVSFTEMLYLVFAGELAFFIGMTEFVLPVLLGNTLGGILLVTVVNYFQTSEKRLESARFAGVERRLSIGEWLFGSLVGRSYVPLIDTGETTTTAADDDTYRVLVPIANPRTESRLVDLAATLASRHDDAIVHVAHIVQVPDRRRSSNDRYDRIIAESENRLADIRESTERTDVEYETSTIVSHRSFEEIFTAAEQQGTDLVVMGWRANQLWDAARAERPLSELTNQLPCDFLVIDDRDLDTSKILLPTAGGPDSDLSAEVACALRSAVGADVSLLYVLGEDEDREDGEQFLGDWAVEHDLGDAELVIDDSGDVEDAIARHAQGKTLLLLGATERGLLSRLVMGSLHLDVVSNVDCSVILAERQSPRSLYQRLFG